MFEPALPSARIMSWSKIIAAVVEAEWLIVIGTRIRIMLGTAIGNTLLYIVRDDVELFDYVPT